MAGAITTGRAKEKQQMQAFVRKGHQGAGHFDVLCHQREGFFLAIFAVAQGVDRLRIACVASEVITAESFL